MNQARRVRTYNNKQNRAALFTGASASGTSPALRTNTPSNYTSESPHLDLESQNDEKIEGLTGKVMIFKEIALSIGESVKESNNLIGTMSDEYSRTSTYIGGTMDKLKRLSTTQSSLFTCIPVI
ncbi:blocked early in transport 1 [Rhizophagus clarus]|uniref:Blocked early in transport 1 n=1 Tax=Rhizophagus clarus TaxID=94130 RepID=A0A8H3QKA7_9GLOM|nr:blocked early in transport 1 [Rhizophagus clarus]